MVNGLGNACMSDTSEPRDPFDPECRDGVTVFQLFRSGADPHLENFRVFGHEVKPGWQHGCRKG